MRRLVIATLLVFSPYAVSAASAPSAPAARTSQGSNNTTSKKKTRSRAVPKKPSAPAVPAPSVQEPAAAPPSPAPQTKEAQSARSAAPAPGGAASASTAPAHSDSPRAVTPSLTPGSSPQAPSTDLFGEPIRRSKVHRYAFVGGGLAAATGAAFGYWARGETRRAESIANAAEARHVLDGAKRTSATAGLLFGVAAASVAYGLVIEFLPERVADKAALTHHF